MVGVVSTKTTEVPALLRDTHGHSLVDCVRETRHALYELEKYAVEAHKRSWDTVFDLSDASSSATSSPVLSASSVHDLPYE